MEEARIVQQVASMVSHDLVKGGGVLGSILLIAIAGMSYLYLDMRKMYREHVQSLQEQNGKCRECMEKRYDDDKADMNRIGEIMGKLNDSITRLVTLIEMKYTK